MTPLDIVGQRFGRLVAEARVGSDKHGAIWRFRCDCGTIVERVAKRVKYSIKSCGCLAHDIHSALASRLNIKHGRTGSREWNSWRSMRDRCENPKAPKFKHYGGRGIAVCDRWHSFENFLLDMGDRPLDTSLDRIDTNGDYEPNNCRWATAMEQRHNRRDSQ